MSFITHTSLGGGLPSGIVSSVYAEISSVPSSALTTILSYNVIDDLVMLQTVSCSGDNIAQFDLLINSTVIARIRTEFTKLNEELDFAYGNANGLNLNNGDVIILKVKHFRPYLGSFEGRIQIVTF